MPSSSKKGNRLIPIDPTQLIPITQQSNLKPNKRKKTLIQPQNWFNLTSKQPPTQSNLIELQPHIAHNLTTSRCSEFSPSSSNDKNRNQTNQKSTQNQSNQILWSESFSPTHPSQLAIHPKKLESVQAWLNDSLNGSNQTKRYRRLLVISGPAGSGKSSMIHSFSHNPILTNTTSTNSKSEKLFQRVILPIKSRAKKSTSQSLKAGPSSLKGIGYEILEWKNTGNESSSSKPQEFSAWLMRATAGPTLSFKEDDEENNAASRLKTNQDPNERSDKPETHTKSKEQPRRVLLVDDLPNLYHQDTLKNFINSIRFHLNSSRPSTPPLIIIMTDTTCKTGENGLNDSLLNANQFNQNQDKALNVHNFLSPDILNHPACYFIKLLPVNKTLMKNFLNRVIDQHLLQNNSTINRNFKKLTPNQIALIVDSSAGDLRYALYNLHHFLFSPPASIQHLTSNTKSVHSFNHNNHRDLNGQLLSCRDESLVIFHGLGKILYNKRWGDDPADDAKDKRLCGPHLDKLPPFWTDFERRLAKTDIDKLYSEISVPIQQFIVYLHHNYPQFLNSIEEGSFLLEYLSLTDSTALCLNDNNRYNQVSISEFYRFHVTARSILLGLPTPVIRRNQKFYKPVLWDNLKSIDSNLNSLDLFRDRRCNNPRFGLDLSFGNGLDEDDDDDGVSVIHSPRNLLAIEVLPFLGLISRFRNNLTLDTHHTSFNSIDEESEILARFTKFNYPKNNNQDAEINEDDIGDDADEEEAEEEDEGINSQDQAEDDLKHLNKNHGLIHDLRQPGPEDEKLWFEDEDDIVD